MVAFPVFTAVTFPLETVATSVLLDVHVTFLFSAFDGAIVAVRVWLSPSARVIAVGLNVTELTVMGAGSFVHPVNVIHMHVRITETFFMADLNVISILCCIFDVITNIVVILVQN